jgi:glucokinase
VPNVESNGVHNRIFVGIDVGGTKTAVLVVDGAGGVLAQTEAATLLDGPQSTLSAIVEAAHGAVESSGRSMRDVGAIGLGVPGRVDAATGMVAHAVNLGWRELAVGDLVRGQLGIPVFLENDVRLAALGVQHYLGSEARNMAYVSVGTGIAAGLVLNGHLYRGAHGLAGEIGHMVVEPGGPLCVCGARGCLEVLASGPAMARMAKEAAFSHGESIGGQTTITAKYVYEAASAGDEVAGQVVRVASRYLALALQQLTVTYDVERIVMGGGVSRNGAAFLQPILEEFDRLRHGSALAGETMQSDKISLLPFGYDAGTWGAVMLAARNAPRHEHLGSLMSNV